MSEVYKLGISVNNNKPINEIGQNIVGLINGDK